MIRVPKIKSRLSDMRARHKRRSEVAEFDGKPGSRLVAGGLCGVLAFMFLINQTQIEGLSPLWRSVSATASICFAVLAWYFLKKGNRSGLLLRVGPDGFGMALGFRGWIEVAWDDVEAFRYWEPTGISLLIKRRQSRWVGILLRQGLSRDSLTWDQRFEIWLNTFHNRPGLCILHPFVGAPILDVLQAFKDHAPRDLDDYEWMSK